MLTSSLLTEVARSSFGQDHFHFTLIPINYEISKYFLLGFKLLLLSNRKVSQIFSFKPTDPHCSRKHQEERNTATLSRRRENILLILNSHEESLHLIIYL
jgi:hypothetical protein